MTPKQLKTHKSLITQVHTSTRYKNYYKENRDAYEEMLYNAFGKRSSKALHVTELIQLVSYLNMQTDALPVFQFKCCTPSQAWKITTLWEQKARDKSVLALLSFCKRITKRECESIATLRVDEAKNILIALQKLQ
ncbi:MAG: DUF1018 domain-containing protein [Campylobacterales bacterium]|nr:DUF1018 domain-containing protein [Campylobacterales bacterium]